MIKILIADDSTVISLLLKAIFEAESDFQVVGIAHDGLEAMRMVKELKPDLLIMDIRMPNMDGIEATRQIMRDKPLPIIIVSSYVDDVVSGTPFTAIDAGAVACITKPVGLINPDFRLIQRELVDTVRALAEIKTITRRSPRTQSPVTLNEPPLSLKPELVAIGCSTGGPQALQSILSHLPKTFALPILITQHMSKGFVGGLVDWLSVSSQLPIELAVEGGDFKPGRVYFAPDNAHLCVERSSNGLVAKLSDQPPINGFRPSVTALLRSVARTCHARAIGLLLTGMGVDGADGMLAMRRAGAHTIVQDEASSIVYGIPAAAIAIDAVDRVIKLSEMAEYLSAVAR